MRKAFYAIFFLMPTLVFATPIETDCSIDIIDNIETLNPHATLVVFDLDNTLLTSDQHFGSEQWFEWQKKLMNMPNYEEGRIFTTMEYLFSFGDILNGFLKMHPVDPLWPDLVKGLQDKGYKVIVETARSLTTIEGTVAQLNQNGFNFYRSEIYRLDPGIGNLKHLEI